jgi:hypothetical protein
MRGEEERRADLDILSSHEVKFQAARDRFRRLSCKRHENVMVGTSFSKPIAVKKGGAGRAFQFVGRNFGLIR